MFITEGDIAQIAGACLSYVYPAPDPALGDRNEANVRDCAIANRLLAEPVLMHICKQCVFNFVLRRTR